MAEYGVKYRFRWNDEGGGDWRIDICQAGYTGDILPRAIGASSVSLRRDRNGNICGTSLELTAECRVDEEFAELYTTDPFEFKVLVYAESVCIWTGYVTPELYSEPFIAPPYDVKVTASDNLGELKTVSWAPIGRVTLHQMLTTLLAQTGLSMGVKYITTLATGSINAQSFFNTVTINLDDLSGETYYDVLDNLLSTVHAVIFQQGGSWIVMRETDVVPSLSGGVVIPAGQQTGLPVRPLGSAYAGGLWPENHVDLTVEPAKKAISLVCQELWERYGSASFTNPQTGEATGSLTATFSAADGINLNNSTTMSMIPLVLNVEALRKDRRTDGKAYFDMEVKIQGNGVTHYLYWDSDNSMYAWRTTQATIRVTDLGDSVYNSGGRRGGATVSRSGKIHTFEFPQNNYITALTSIQVTFRSNSIGSSGRPTVYRPSVYFFDAWISYGDQFTSLMDTVAINNSARGAASDVKLLVSGLTDVALEKYFIANSFLDGSGALIGAVHTSAFEGQDYISLLSRDYAQSIAAPRLRAEGVFYGQERTDIPLFMTMGGLNYVIETWDWNLITGGVDFSALTLPAVTVSVTSETIITGDNLGHGTSSGSGGSGGSSSSGAGYVAPGTGVPSLAEAYIGTTQIQPAPYEGQDLTGIGNATLSGKLNLPQGAYLEVVNVGTTANPVYAVHTNIGLYSDGFISAFGASDTGGGGGGIDLSAMWANLQVNESGTTGYNLQINPGHLTTALGTYVNGFTTTGSGNAITSVSKDGSTLTFTKGSTFALASRTVTGTGYLTGGGALSANRTIDIASTYKGYIDEGHTAYGWGDHSQAGYLTGITSSMVTAALGFTPANSTALGNYLPLTGGTLTGATEVKYTSQEVFSVNRTNNNIVSIGFYGRYGGVDDTALGRIGYSPTGAWVRDASDSDYRYIYHTGNLTLATLAGSTAIGSSTNPVYYTGSAFAACNLSTTYAPYNADGYLPLSGGTMTGNLNLNYGSNLNVKFDVDTSRARVGLRFLNTADENIGQILMHNTAKSIYINATGASDIFNDAVGKYSLRIGQDRLSYNTYDIYHTNNLTQSVVTGLIGSTTYAPYNADGYLPLSGGTMTGSPVLSNAVYLRANNAAGTDMSILGITASDNLLVGYGTAGQGYETHIYGGSTVFHYGTGRAVGMTLTSGGNVGIGVAAPTVKLQVAGAVTATGAGTFQTLTLTSTAAANHINFSRAGANYINLPTGGALNFSVGGYGGANTMFRINATGVAVNMSISATNTFSVGGTIYASTGIYSDGYVSAFGQSTTSDARLKKDFLDTTLTVDDIAHAPAITFLWKDREGKRQAGSLAQYWETVLPEVVTDIEGKKGLDYGAAALVSAITIARDVNDHEKRIRELERENRELKRRLGYAMG